jgi:large exoprotein involved in heme utilization and adhesion
LNLQRGSNCDSLTVNLPRGISEAQEYMIALLGRLTTGARATTQAAPTTAVEFGGPGLTTATAIAAGDACKPGALIRGNNSLQYLLSGSAVECCL